MFVALCFWGIARSLKYTINSIENNILNILKENNIEYKIYFHTYTSNSKYNNPRANEYDCKLDNNEYKILQSDYIEVEDQDKIKLELDVKKYRTHGDAWHSNFNTLDNFILAMYSRKKLWKLIVNSKEYDKITHYIFVRPDVKFLNKFNIKWLNIINENQIFIPNFHLFHFGFNDRMCICKKSIAEVYSNIFTYIYLYSLRKKVHSETLIRDILLLRHPEIEIIGINFYFNRIRANGFELSDNRIY